MRFSLIIAILLLLGSCGGATTADLTVDVRPEGDPVRPGGLVIANTSDLTWNGVDVRLERTEEDGSTSPCGARALPSWAPGEEIRVPACGERTRITIESDEASAIYVFAGGRLYRRLGRKEVPVVR